MDLPVHNQILWNACVRARDILQGDAMADPTGYFPFLVKGSWMNDMNQSTLFTDVIPRSGDKNGMIPSVDDASLDFFRLLWAIDLNKLIRAMAGGSASAQTAAGWFAQTYKSAVLNDPLLYSSAACGIPGFGHYSRYNHLDVLEQDTRTDYYEWYLGSDYAVSRTIASTLTYNETILTGSTFDRDSAQRMDETSLTNLGRVLHSVADFYAHSNYVELLLWSMAHAKDMDDWMLEEFNRKDEFLIDLGRNYVHCPLPVDAGTWQLVESDAALWYGSDPRSTPLGSCLFDSSDTAYSLLKMYAIHLEKIDNGAPDDETLDMAMAVFGVPDRDSIMKAVKLYTGVKQSINDLGQKARYFLSDVLVNIGKQYGGQTQGILNTLSGIVRQYRSKEAKEWARAGSLRYIAYTIQNFLLEELKGQKPDVPRLPHHSLLCKDNMPGSAKDALRYSLACLFATEITAELIALHFSKKKAPTASDYRALTAKYCMHPGQLLEKKGFDQVVLKQWIDRGDFGGWQRVFTSTNKGVR